ncbi:MAG: SBBP repeat-containing protein [bacterium]|nr:SBBP repeat-containing protein [bacterium]
MLRSVTALLVCCLTAITVLSTVRPSNRQSRIPSAFVKNVGQVVYTSGRHAAHVDATFSSGNTTALIHATGMHVVQRQPSKSVGVTPDDPSEYDMYRMDMKLLGSNPHARIEWLEKSDGYSRYLTQPGDLPNGRVADHYARLCYHDVWPGIDMRMYIADEGMEYDFVVHPGADPKRIAFFMDGAQEMGLTAGGGLTVRTPLGTMSEAAPYTYTYRGIETKNSVVESRFVADGRSVRFAIGAYDKTQTLVIDPKRVWATYFGFNDGFSSLKGAIDPFGNVLMSGATSATNLPENVGVLQKRYKANTDGCIVKFDDTGRFLWCTYFGGSRKDYINGVCSDQTGNIYSCGTTFSEEGTLPATLGVGSAPFGDPDSLGVSNGFVLGLSPTGAWIDHWFLYGRDEDECTDMAFRSDLLAVVGTSRSPRVGERVGTPFRHDDFNNFRNQDMFVCQFKRHATIANRWLGEWLTFAGGDFDDNGIAVAMDVQGAVYIVGSTQGLGIQVTDGSTYSGAGDFYVAKFTGSSGTAVQNWSGIVGGTGLDGVKDITVDGAGAAIAVGYTTSSNFPLKNAMKGALEGIMDGFIRKYASGGTVMWSTYFGGEQSDVFTSVATDQANRVWVCGYTASSPDMPITTDAIQTAPFPTSGWPGIAQGYLAELREDGQSVVYGTYYGAPPQNPLPPFGTPPDPPLPSDDFGTSIAEAIACDANANILVIHSARTLRMDTTKGAYQDSSKLDHANIRDNPFITLFTNCVDSVIVANISGSPALCTGETRTLLGPTGFALYRWSTGATTRSITVSDSGRYIITGITADGCRYHDTLYLTRNAKPVVDAGTDVSRCKDTLAMLTATVSAGTPPYKYKWSRIESGPEFIDVDTSRTPNVNPPTTTRYEVVVTDAIGCVAKDTVQVSIVDPKPTGPSAEVDFGVLDPCEATKDANIVISNPMPYELRVESFTSDIVSIVTSLAPPPVIPANGTITLVVRISPTQIGNTTGNMRFTGSPCAWSVTVPYRVNKARLTATISPSTLGFGASADCETVQRDSTVVIRNGGTDPMTVSPGSILPGGQPFSIVSPTTPTAVAPNDSLSVVIRYAPSTSGAFNASASFPFVAGTCSNGSLTVTLSASRSAVNITAIPSTIDVGTLGGCQDFVDTVVTISNGGDVSVTITLPAIAGVSFTPPGPITIAAGATENVGVRITPAGQGPFAFSGNVLAEPCGISRPLLFSGTKAGATVSVPSQIDFGKVIPCSGPDFSKLTFTIAFDGAADATLVTVSHGSTIQTTAISGMTLTPGVARAFDITWSPITDGAFVDSLVLVIEPCSIRRVIRLFGLRTNVSLIASTPLVNLGVITGPEIGQAMFVNNGTDTLNAVASALTPDVTITSTIPTTLNGILPGGSISVNYELNCNGRTDVLDSIRVSSVTPCVVDATTEFIGTCGAAPSSSADVAIDTTRVLTGQNFLVALRMLRSTGLNALNARTWSARITYNPGVLVGIGATPDCFTGSFSPCAIDIGGTRGSDTVGVLMMLNFTAVLGTDSATDLTIESFAWTDATISSITTRNGRVSLTDICEEGDTRLLKPKAGRFGIDLNPTPITQRLTITATELGTDIASYTLHNIVGVRVASGTLIPDAGGHAEAHVDATSMAVGTYVFSATARGHAFRQIIFINR